MASLFGRVSPHSLGAVAAATGAGVRENLRLQNNKCMSFKQTNKCFKHYECSKSRKQHSEQVSRLRSEEGSQGVDTPLTDLTSVSAHISTTFVEAQSTGFRGLTTNLPSELSTTSSETIGRANPSLHSRTTCGPSLSITGQSTVGSTVSERHTTNGRDHLSVHSDLLLAESAYSGQTGKP